MSENSDEKKKEYRAEDFFEAEKATVRAPVPGPAERDNDDYVVVRREQSEHPRVQQGNIQGSVEPRESLLSKLKKGFSSKYKAYKDASGRLGARMEAGRDKKIADYNKRVMLEKLRMKEARLRATRKSYERQSYGSVFGNQTIGASRPVSYEIFGQPQRAQTRQQKKGNGGGVTIW